MVATRSTVESLVARYQALRFTADVLWAWSKTAFTPALDLVYAAITLPTYPGYANIASSVPAIDYYFDPITNGYQFYAIPTIVPPITKASGAAAPPESLFGWLVIEDGSALMVCSQLYPTPIPITSTLDGAIAPLTLFRVGLDIIG